MFFACLQMDSVHALGLGSANWLEGLLCARQCLSFSFTVVDRLTAQQIFGYV